MWCVLLKSVAHKINIVVLYFISLNLNFKKQTAFQSKISKSWSFFIIKVKAAWIIRNVENDIWYEAVRAKAKIGATTWIEATTAFKYNPNQNGLW